MRPLHSWPRWRLNLVIKAGTPRHLVAEAFIEIHERGVEEAAEHASATADDESGPYLVAPLKGMH